MSLPTLWAQRPLGSDALRWRETLTSSLGVYLQDVLTALNRSGVAVPEEFIGMTPGEVLNRFAQCREELEHAVSLSLLSAAEAGLRTDFVTRVRAKSRDALSRAFRQVYKAQGSKVRLDEDILDLWVEHHPPCKAAVSNFRGALHYRHWLAHGRYWTPKLGRRYDSLQVEEITTQLFAALPGITVRF